MDNLYAVAGLDGTISIRFDDAQRPVVEAASWNDAAAGLGWCVARHRREQMDVLRRLSQGRLAEVAGRAALASDVRQRVLNLSRVAQECWDLLPPEQRSLLRAFAHGVNANPSGHPAWRPVDSIGVAQYLFGELSSDGEELRMVEVMRRTLPASVVDFVLCPRDEYATEPDGGIPSAPPAELPLEELRELLAAPADARSTRVVVAERRPVGSNAWAASSGGVAVLANDMHLSLTTPSLWYSAELLVRSDRVTGVTLPGLPLIVAGSNGSTAWGFTRLPADTVDLREVRPGANANSYRHSEGDEVYELRKETVSIAAEPDVTVDVLETRWGPVVGELRDRPLAHRSTLTDPRAIDFGGVRLYHARDVREAVDIITDSGLPPVNAIVADAEGAVAWTVGGRMPRRPGGPRGFETDGVRGTPEWLAPGEHPRVVVTGGGIVVNCNNGSGAGYRAGIGWNYFSGCRARHVAEMLSSGAGRTEMSAFRLQLDTDAAFYSYYRDLALRHLPPTITGSLREMRDEVQEWGGTSDTHEVGLALLVVFRDCLRETVFSAVTRPAQEYDREFTYCFNGHEHPLRRILSSLEQGLVPAPWRGPAHFVAGQLMMARAILTRRVGHTRPVRWGELNVLAPVPLGNRYPAASGIRDPIELPGCPESVCVAQPDFGAALRMVVSPGRRDAGLLSIPGGQAGEPRDDEVRFRRWARGLPDAFTPETKKSDD